MDFPNSTSLLFLTLGIFMQVSSGAGTKYGEIKCGVMFKPTEELLEGFKTCHERMHNKEGGNGNQTKGGGGIKGGIKKFLSEDAKLEDFIDLDDGCMRECHYQVLGVINEDGLLDKKQTEDLFKDSNTSPKMEENLFEFWNSCIDETEKLMQEKGVTDSCKTMMVHDFCFMRKIRSVKVDC